MTFHDFTIFPHRILPTDCTLSFLFCLACRSESEESCHGKNSFDQIERHGAFVNSSAFGGAKSDSISSNAKSQESCKRRNEKMTYDFVACTFNLNACQKSDPYDRNEIGKISDVCVSSSVS